MSAIRGASMKWGPKNECKKQARVSRGKYLCAHCGNIVDASLPVVSKDGSTERVNNAIVDHIEPVIPVSGFSNWDDVVGRMFVEVDGLQLLCRGCHDIKTKAENEERKRLTKV